MWILDISTELRPAQPVDAKCNQGIVLSSWTKQSALGIKTASVANWLLEDSLAEKQ